MRRSIVVPRFRGPRDPQMVDHVVSHMSLYGTRHSGNWPIDGLASIVELLRVVINVLDPNDRLHTDSIRLTVLRILNVAFEASGTRLCAYPSLVALIVDQGCKFLFQLARSDNFGVLQAALRTIATMFEIMRPKLKLQQELFLAFTIDRLAPPAPAKSQAAAGRPSPRPPTPIPSHLEQNIEQAPPTPRLLVAPAKGDTRELLLETLCLVSRHPSFMVDLYVNYDCDMNCENMFERIIEFATKVCTDRFYVDDGSLTLCRVSIL